MSDLGLEPWLYVYLLDYGDVKKSIRTNGPFYDELTEFDEKLDFKKFFKFFISS